MCLPAQHSRGGFFFLVRLRVYVYVCVVVGVSRSDGLSVLTADGTHLASA